MANDEAVLKALRAAFESDPRIGSHRGTIHLALMSGALTIEGEVPTVAARRLALRLARGTDGVTELVDCLQVSTPVARGDGQIAVAFADALLGVPDFRNCSVHRREGARCETLHEANGDDGSGELVFAVADGVITLDGHVLSLTHLRLAEVVAWRAPGCRQVANRLRVEPPQDDNDDEINDAVRLALELDPLVPAAGIHVGTILGVVTLDGILTRRIEREHAEHAAWCVPGVGELINRLTVAAD